MTEQNRSYMKDFLAGVDPTGTSTFQYGMQDESGEGSSSGRQALHTIGGTLGGAAVMPAAISGVIGGIKGLATGKGGLKGRLMYAGRSAFSGAKQPYTDLLGGLKSRKLLKSIQPGQKLTAGQSSAADALSSRMVPTQFSSIPGAKETAQKTLREGLEKANPQQLAEAKRFVGGEVASGAGALGLSGLVSGASAHRQYDKGVRTQQDVNKQLGKLQKTSSFISGAKSTLHHLGIF